MFYKRSEYFRYTFGEPLQGEFRLLLSNGEERKSKPGECLLIDISPGGSKIYCEFDIPMDQKGVRMSLTFTLHEDPIETNGQIVWKKPSKSAYLYGVDFDPNDETEELIVNELKLMRRSDATSTKKG
ncbi:MAG TPA: PilZ domain-containing protein [Sporosarcina sp.]|nr:PilZ domain-containing protein [Sporosarcina sp.]